MKILFVSKFFFPNIGGIETHLENLNLELQKKDFQISIITTKASNTSSFEVHKDINIYRIAYPKIKFVGLVIIWTNLISKFKLFINADIIHIHDVFVWCFPLKLIFPSKTFFITFHGYENYPVKKKHAILRRLAEQLCDGNICIGNFMKKWYKTTPSLVCYGGIDTNKYLAKKICIAKYNAYFSSRLDEQTGILEYLKTVKILRKRGIKFKLAVLGDGIYREQADKVATTFGFVKDPAPYFKVSRFAFVSRYLAILEAMACKKLVFATYDNPLKEDYLRMTPFAKWIIIEKDPKKLADKVEYYMNHPEEEKKLTEPAYHWARKQTWDKVAKVYLKLWKDAGIDINK